MKIIDNLNPSDVLFVDRTGFFLIFYCKNDIKITKCCNNVSNACKLLTKYRRKFENKKLGE